MTAKHRFFRFCESEVLPDQGLIAIASDDLFHMGILSSKIHVSWALSAGGRLGVGNDPRYNNSVCFESFPFPDAEANLADRIRRVVGEIEERRQAAQSCGPPVTMTGIHNVLEKLLRAEPLTPTERKIHDLAACGVILDLHKELDALVAEAYGWPGAVDREEILTRLVELHAQRVEEEKGGKVRWLRPDYQIPRFGEDIEAEDPGLHLEQEPADSVEIERVPWPSTTIEQIAALQRILSRTPSTLDEAAEALTGARKDLVSRHLETLVLMGEAWVDPSGVYHLVEGASV